MGWLGKEVLIVMNEIEELEELEDDIRVQKLRVSLRKIWEELRKEGLSWWEIELFMNQEWREFQKRRI